MADDREKGGSATRPLSPQELASALQKVRGAAGSSPVERRGSTGFSSTFVEAFPETERAAVEEIEHRFAIGEVREGILRCATLVERSLHVDGIEEPSLALLLGIDGAEWVRFRSIVRAAREGAVISPQSVVECFAFVLTATRHRR